MSNSDLDERQKKENAMTERELPDEKVEREKILQEKHEVEEELKDTKHQQFTDVLWMFENEMFCTICNEIFISPMTIDCGHVFCSFCIDEWKKTGNKTCPICRTKFTKQIKNFNFINLIESMFKVADDETQMKRKTEMAERQKKQGIRGVLE